MCCPQFSLNLEVELDNDPGTFEGSTTNRKCTDPIALILLFIILGVIIGLSIYCILNSDIDKFRNGYDDCGNICGKINEKTDFLSCSGKNMEKKKYVYIRKDGAHEQTKECVEDCKKSIGSPLVYVCASEETLLPYYIEMQNYWPYLFAVWLCSGLFSCIIFTLPNDEKRIKNMRCIFLVYILILLLYWGNIIIERFEYNTVKRFTLLIIIAAILTVWMLLFFLLLFTYQSKLKLDLSFVLYSEALNAIKAMKLFWLLPVLSSIMVTAFTFILLYGWLWIQSFSYLEQINPDASDPKTEYVQYPIATVTGALLIYAYLLLCEIVKNCQCMIVGGYVAQWYFTRSNVMGPKIVSVSTAVGNLFKYHLGTICCGSLVLPFAYVLRCVVNAIKGAAGGNNKETVYTCSCQILSETSFATFTNCLECFSQNGFIMTAMYGCTYCAGTIRAHKLIRHNSFNAVGIYTFGDMCLIALKWFNCLLVMVFSSMYFILAGGYELTNQKLVFAIFLTVITFTYTNIFFSVMDVAIHTLFLCFCEDCQYNNGTSKPYYMTPNFANFIENANIFVDPIKWKLVADMWEKGPKRLY